MLAAVFFFQPFGQLIAVLMAFAATAGFKSYIRIAGGALACSVDAQDLDGIACARNVDRAWRLVAGLGTVPAAVAMLFRFTIPESVYYNLDIRNDSSEAMNAREYFPARHGEDEDNMSDGLQLDEYASAPKAATSGHNVGAPANGLRHTAEGVESSQAVLDAYPLPEESNRGSIFETTGVEEALEDPHPAQASWADFRKYLFTDGNWIDLFATSISWMLLDFTFYLLGVNSSSFVPTLFGESIGSGQPPYRILISNERHIMESTSIGALLGSMLAIAAMHFYSRKKAQTYGFLVLGFLFIIVGALYITLPSTNAHVAIVVFYGICQLFYNLGPNTTTFIKHFRHDIAALATVSQQPVASLALSLAKF
ncbi:hypothetical protein P7C71_g4075, partial [Lecanoromycetidae sp. Uapishka_2]